MKIYRFDFFDLEINELEVEEKIKEGKTYHWYYINDFGGKEYFFPDEGWFNNKNDAIDYAIKNAVINIADLEGEIKEAQDIFELLHSLKE